MPVAAAIAAVVISAASTAYSGYIQNDNAIDAKKAAEKAAAEEEKRARLAAALASEQAKTHTTQLKSKQLNALAGAGVDLNASGLVETTLNETERLGNQNQNLIDENLRIRLQDSETNKNNIINSQPGLGSIIAQGALNFAATALNAYSGSQSQQSQQNLLTKQYGNLNNSAYYTSTGAQTSGR